jgi:hypothetical protein
MPRWYIKYSSMISFIFLIFIVPSEIPVKDSIDSDENEIREEFKGKK